MGSPRLLSLLGLLCGACADPTALDLSLVVDQSLQSESALVSRLVRLRLVVDAPEGLYPATSNRRDGELEILDRDGDGQSELSVGVELGSLGRLPLIRLERGGMPPAASGLELKVDGLGPDGDTGPDAELAAGGLAGVTFTPGEIASVSIPFNLRATYRPPRVTQVFPEDGATLGALAADSGTAFSVAILFSKPMNPGSLRQPAALEVLAVQGAAETPLALAEIVVGEIFPGSGTRVVLRLAQPPPPGTYRVRVGQAALDTSGRPLDQVPMQPGNQPFQSSFTVRDGAQAASTCADPCPRACAHGGSECPEGLRCDTASRSCVPRQCPGRCSDGLSVCDPVLVACVEDCRRFGSYGGCPASKQHCEVATGFCR